MAHICAVAGREPVKVSENSGSEALDQGPEACASRVRPAGNEKSRTFAGRVQVFLTDRASSDFRPLAEDEDANPELVKANIRQL